MLISGKKVFFSFSQTMLSMEFYGEFSEMHSHAVVQTLQFPSSISDFDSFALSPGSHIRSYILRVTVNETNGEEFVLDFDVFKSKL